MKKQVFLLVGLCFFSLAFFAQNNSNLVIFAEDGDLFYAYVNGIKQNSKAESNVKVTGLSPNVSLRIEFEDKALPQLKQNMVLEPGFEITAKIKRDMKKQLKLRYFGQVPIAEAVSGVPTVAYHTANEPVATNNTANNTATNNTSINSNVGVNQTITTTTTKTTKTTNTVAAGDPNNVSVNINLAGMGVNMNVNGMDGTAPGTNVNTTTSTTVTSSSSSSGSGNFNNEEHFNNERKNERQHSQTTPVTPTPIGCSVAMSGVSFAKMKQAVADKPFSETKMSTAKVATKNACLSVEQVKEICKLFSMDDDKLVYAKYAYDYCVDKANYYQVSEVFSFSSTTDDFNKFLEK
jgi:hypothetical protein